MKRWGIPLLAVLLASVLPLKDGFNKPLLSCFLVLALFWFLRELTDSPLLSTAAGLLFAAWLTGLEALAIPISCGLAVVAAAIGLFRHGIHIKRYLPAVFIFLYLPLELVGADKWVLRGFGDQNYSAPNFFSGEPPAVVMTLFALLATASYARFERLGASRELPPPGPLDPPATRSSQAAAGSSNPWPWAVTSVICAGLAIAVDRQAVGLPAALLIVAFCLRLQGWRVHWSLQFAFWTLLSLNWVLPREAVPATSSSAWLQSHIGDTPHGSILIWMFPSLHYLMVAGQTPLAQSVIGGLPGLGVLGCVSNLAAWLVMRRRWVLAITGWSLSIFAYIPTAFLPLVGQNFYWPMAMRSLFVTVLIWIGFQLLTNAARPRELQAPERLSPAPGSLPRP